MSDFLPVYGFKKQKGQARKPHVAPDDLVSTSYAKILYGLAEGEILGLVDGGKSIKLDGTPLVNSNGQPNFDNVHWDFRTGTLDQTHIAGFAAVENETNVGVELRSDRAWVKAVSNRELSAVRVRLNFSSLREQKDNGDIAGYAIEYAIDVQTDGGSFQEIMRQIVRGKSSQGYKKSHRIDLPKGNKWTIRVRRITPNRNSELVGDTVYIDALTEIIDAKLAYPCTALLGLSYDAKTFSNIAKLAVRLKGKLIQVPTNYNADVRQYNGLWDGTFKLAYSNNPAWVFYDLCTHKRYGLGERLAGLVDKWKLYQIGQYCDEMVDDGKGGKEPRFTVNVYIQKADDAYRVLQNLASVFRGLSFWDGQDIVVDADTPKEPVYTFSPANVVGGEFTYTGTRARDRHTLAKVAWDNPENGFNTEYELIPDEQAIAKYGVRTLDIAAFGCTSQGQAQRAGLWALKAEQLETQTVSFKTGLQGFIPKVGQVINIADNVFAGRAISGKVMAVGGDKHQITLDRHAGKSGDTLIINAADGVQSAKIAAVHGQVLTLDKPINAAPEHIWAVVADDLKLKQFRILAIAQNDDAIFNITALEYSAKKYHAVDFGAVVTQEPFTALKATPIAAPKSVIITANTRTHQAQAITTLTISWSQVEGATAYVVKWRKDDGNWQTLPKVAGQSVDIDGVYGGVYIARVRALDSFYNESLATSSQLTNIKGKTGKPPRLASLTAKGLLFGMELGWTFNKGSDDTNFTEIEVSPDGRSNITTLGTFAYPTNKHEITGLQGNLTQFYRARIVDKLGNTSDWTAWTKATTEAKANKVLDLLNGQITQDQLHQSLTTPVGKIPSLETTLNQSKTQLTQAQKDLAALNQNITTERNRITSTIRDIATLQSANHAKTQEIANLSQTVNSHTSQLQDLAVATGDLSQKYSQLKTASDKSNSEITTIKQTQASQATTLSSIKTVADKAKTDIASLAQTVGNNEQALTKRIEQIDSAYKTANTQTQSKINQLNQTINTKEQALSNLITGLTAKYTDLNIKTDNHKKLVDSAINTEQQTRVNADNALTQRINQLESNYKTADNHLTSKLNQAQQAISSANSALTTAKTELNARLNNISIGGRNLLLATNKMSDTQFWKFSKHKSQTQAELPRTDSTLTLKSNNHAWTQYYQRSDNNTVLADELQGSQTYTLSFEARANTLTAGYIRTFLRQHYQGGSNQVFKYFTVSQVNLWEKFSYTFVLQEKHTNHINWQFIMEINNITAGQFEFRKVKLEKGNIATDWTPAPEDLQTNIDNINAKLDEHKQTQVTKDSATTQKLTQLESAINTKANATALNNLTTKTNQIDGKLNAEANKINTLQTNVNNHTASIEQHAQSLSGLSAQWTLKVQSGNIVSGIGLASNNGVSDFAVRADKFYIASPNGQKGDTPFTVLSNQQVINGVQVPAGTYISSAFIQDGSITNAKIANASIDNAKIKDGSINTAKIANASINNAKIANGAITAAKIGTAQIGTLQIAGEAVTVPRAQSFDNHRAGLSGQVFSLSMNAMGGSVLISASFLVDCTNTVSRNSRGYAKAIATINKKLKLVIKCNGSVISERMFTFKDEREKEKRDDLSSGNRTVTATATAFVYDKMVSIINHVHKNPPDNAVYTVELHDSGGDGLYVVTNGSVLLLGIKR